MSKKIKSLLMAVLLVIGMGFAKVNSFAEETKAFTEKFISEIRDIDFVKGEKEKIITIQQGYITVTIKNNDGVYDVIVEWDKTVVDVVGIDSLFEKGSQYSDFNTCYDVKYDGNKVIVTIKEVNVVPEGFDPVGELTGINVHFKLADLDGDTIPDFKDDLPEGNPKDPNTKDPETGDASMIFVVGVAVTSAVVLYVTRKKDDEE